MMGLTRLTAFLLLLCLLPTIALGETEQKGEGSDMTMPGFNPDKLRQGSEVSGAYVDPAAQQEVPEDQRKATGFAYDEGALTWDLVWSDEFDYEGAPDPQRWDYDVGGHGWGNNELQFYTKEDNAAVGNGILTIEARKEQRENRGVTSTRLVSRGKGDWLYGKFEIRAKLPRGLGTWPAIWMLPTDWEYGGWPDSGEIDIMEHVGYDQGRIHATVHTKAFNHSIGTQKSAQIMVPDASEAFHTYQLTWLPDKIEIAVDGETYYTYRPAQYVSQPTFREWPFDKRHHLLINLAFGGNWGGARGVDEGVLPQRFEVDWVRVYQSPELKGITRE